MMDHVCSDATFQMLHPDLTDAACNCTVAGAAAAEAEAAAAEAGGHGGAARGAVETAPGRPGALTSFGVAA